MRQGNVGRGRPTTVRKVSALAVAAALAAVAGCSGPLGARTADAPLVGVAMPGNTSARWVSDGENVRDQLQALGYGVDLQYAADDARAQAAQLDAMLDRGADLLIVASVDGTVLKDALARAAAAHVPVISYDRLIRESPDVTYYVTFDNQLVGVQQATALLEGLGVLDASGAPTGARGPFTIELFAGSPDDNNATVFYQAALDTLRPYLDAGVLRVGSGQTDFAAIATPGWSGDKAAERMTSLLGSAYASGARIDGILSPYDGISRGVLQVLGGAGYGTDRPWPVVTGQDAEVDSVKSIIRGEQYATVYKDTRDLAEAAVAGAYDLLRGRAPETNDTTTYDNGVKVVPSELLPTRPVTAASYERVLVDSGYYTREELS